MTEVELVVEFLVRMSPTAPRTKGRRNVKTRYLAGTAALTALSLMLTVCGGPSVGASVRSSTGTTQGIDGKTILIGSSQTLSGPAIAAGEVGTGFSDYIKYINSQGGVSGYKFKVIEQDNQYTAAGSVEAARNLVFNDQVFALTVTGTTPSQAVIPLASQLKVPILFVANADLVPHTTSNLFGEEPSFTRLALFDAHYIIKTLDEKKIAYAYEDDDVGQPPLDALPGYVQSQGGSLVTKVGFPVTATDYNVYAEQLKASGAGGVLVFANTANFADLQKAAAAIGYNPKWYSLFASVSPTYVQLAGAQAQGTYMDNFLELVNANTASARLFRTEAGASASGLAELGWTDAALLVEGVKVAAQKGSLTQKSFETALTTLNHKYIGTWPDSTFTPTSHSGATSAQVIQVENGQFVQRTAFSPLPQIP